MFYEIAKVLSLALMTFANGDFQNGEITTSKVHEFVGTWEWVSTNTSGRAGLHVELAGDTKTTKTLVITADYKLKVYTNDELSCESGFKPVKSKDGLSWKLQSNCMNGTLSFREDGQLSQYEYLGCPSRTTLYKRK